DILDNVIPYIGKEEEKVKKELVKIIPGTYLVGATCTRVHVRDGHTETVTVETEKPCTPESFMAAVVGFNKKCREQFGPLPSAPNETIVLADGVNRPQPRLDRNTHNGMATVVGRIRTEDVFPNSISFVLLSHNTKRGAALGEILTAEYLYKQGYIA
ncbi:aspartate-semialdehyde dehydrogenase, partial [Candidatus Woesearchaeota archaeon CG11_big_fil_rev_8_21_14_0_20_57_5]